MPGSDWAPRRELGSCRVRTVETIQILDEARALARFLAHAPAVQQASFVLAVRIRPISMHFASIFVWNMSALLAWGNADDEAARLSVPRIATAQRHLYRLRYWCVSNAAASRSPGGPFLSDIAEGGRTRGRPRCISTCYSMHRSRTYLSSTTS